MKGFALREMDDEEFGQFVEATVTTYASEQVAAGVWSEGDAMANALASFKTLAPAGLKSEGVRFLVATLDNEVVGRIWLSLTNRSAATAWLYSIEVLEAYRGRGLGRELLSAAERVVAKAGIATLGLNVFGHNHVARALYDSAGYEIQTMQMVKHLDVAQLRDT